jgi:hypothetical protein
MPFTKSTNSILSLFFFALTSLGALTLGALGDSTPANFNAV